MLDFVFADETFLPDGTGDQIKSLVFDRIYSDRRFFMKFKRFAEKRGGKRLEQIGGRNDVFHKPFDGTYGAVVDVR